MSKIVAFFRLVRWPNLLMTALMMCMVYHFIMLIDSNAAFTLLVMSMVFIVAGGYVINDIFDKDIDAVNKPERLVVGKVFSVRQCKVFYWVLTAAGLACALASTIIAYGTRFYIVFLCMMLLAGVLYSYSSAYKKKLIVGNVIVSLLVAFAVFLPWLFVMLYMSENPLILKVNENMMTSSLHLVLIYTGLAFLTTLIREIIKDVEDVEGDSRNDCMTIPVAWSSKVAGIIVAVLMFLLSCFYLRLKIFFDGACTSKISAYMIEAVFVLSMAVFAGVIMTVKQMVKEPKKAWHLYSVMMKVIMLIGVMSMIFINF